MMTWIKFSAVFILAMVLTSAALAEDPPPVFSKLSFDEAVGATKSAEKILIVKFTAAWCGPCKQMDKTTWRGEKVVAWVKDNGLAIQVDVDEQKDLAKAQRIQAMPTMVAFKGAKEFDRVVGYKSADELLTWLNAVRGGERSGDKTIKQLEQMRKGEIKLSMQDRLTLAGELVRMEKFDDATEEYAWLWDNMVKEDPGMIGVRGSFMIGDMNRLAMQHAPARKRFGELRAAAAAQFKSDTERPASALIDWMALNEAIDDEATTLEWFDRVRGKPEADELLDNRRVAFKLERLLQKKNRWADFASRIRDPIATLKAGHAELVEERDYREKSFRSNTAKLYAGLLAAGREKEATEYADLAMSLDASAAMPIALVEQVLQAGQARPGHRKMLDASEKAGGKVEELRGRLTMALEKK